MFTAIVDLQAAIKRYIAEHNKRPRPFVWTKPAAAIFNSQAAPAVYVSALDPDIEHQDRSESNRWNTSEATWLFGARGLISNLMHGLTRERCRPKPQ